MKSTLILVILFLVVLLFLCFFSDNLSAQTVNSDSLKRVAFSIDSLKQDSIAEATKIIDIAKRDARKLNLNSTQMLRFKADNKNTTSDFFKPQINLASNAALLSDSVYVKAFRLAAYRNALDVSNKDFRWGWYSGSVGVNSTGNLSLLHTVYIELPKNLLVGGDVLLENIPNGFGGPTALINAGVLFGGVFKQNFSFLTVSAGLNIVTEFNLFQSSPFGIGVPIVVQGYLHPLKFAGIGVGGYLNLNTIKTTAGVNFSLAFGKLTRVNETISEKTLPKPYHKT